MFKRLVWGKTPYGESRNYWVDRIDELPTIGGEYEGNEVFNISNMSLAYDGNVGNSIDDYDYYEIDTRTKDKKIESFIVCVIKDDADRVL
jgi:hypothetical protein